MSKEPVLEVRRRGMPAWMPSPIARRWLPLVVGLGVGLRWALAWNHPYPFPDAVDYDTLAKAIEHGRAYVTGENLASRMPGYPAFMSIIYLLSGDSQRAVYAVQAILGGATIVFVYLLGKRLNQRVGLLAAALAAIDPLSVGFAATLLSETAFTFCLMWALWLAVRIVEEREKNRGLAWTQWALLGILWGVAVYLRASALWLIVPMILWIAWCKRDQTFGRSLAYGGLTLLLVLFVLSPWLTRNYRLFGSGYFRLTTLEGMSLYEAVYPGADGGPRQTTIAIPPEMVTMNEAQKNDEWGRRAWQEIRNNPGRVARLAVVKVGRTWSPTFNDKESGTGVIQLIMLLWHVLLYFFGVIGLCLMRSRLTVLLLIPVIYFTLIHGLFLGSVRYRVPLMPIVCLFAAYGLLQMVNLFFGRKRQEPSPV